MPRINFPRELKIINCADTLIRQLPTDSQTGGWPALRRFASIRSIAYPSSVSDGGDDDENKNDKNQSFSRKQNEQMSINPSGGHQFVDFRFLTEEIKAHSGRLALQGQ